MKQSYLWLGRKVSACEHQDMMVAFIFSCWQNWFVPLPALMLAFITRSKCRYFECTPIFSTSGHWLATAVPQASEWGGIQDSWLTNHRNIQEPWWHSAMWLHRKCSKSTNLTMFERQSLPLLASSMLAQQSRFGFGFWIENLAPKKSYSNRGKRWPLIRFGGKKDVLFTVLSNCSCLKLVFNPQLNLLAIPVLGLLNQHSVAHGPF